MATVGLSPDPDGDSRDSNRLYECSYCRKHYLTDKGILDHIRTERGGKGTYSRVPLAAAEFD